MINPKMVGLLVAAFVAGSFFAPPVQQAIAAVIATDVQCTGCVGNADIASSAVTNSKIASNAVTSAKITDGTITAADLAADSVAGSEIKGVTKLLFAVCSFSSGTTFAAGQLLTGIGCSVPGAATGDLVTGTLRVGNPCFIVDRAGGFDTDTIAYDLRNVCSVAASPGSVQTSFIVFK